MNITEARINGDFRSEDCTTLLKQADIVLTNPPFSLFRDFLKWLMQFPDKKFIILGNKNAITYKEFFPYIKSNEVWLGCSIHSGERYFYQPSINGLSKGIGVRWFTNLDNKDRHESLILTKKYTGNEEDYPKYDNYDAIDVSKTCNIPLDYDGVMGVPITFLDKYNPDQFEIVAFRKGNDDKDLVYTKGGNIVQPYFRILVKRKK